MVKIIFVILSVTWVAVGRAHQIYHTHLKGIPVRFWKNIMYANRFEILQSGVLGYFTPYYHNKWNKTKQTARPVLRRGKLVEMNKAVNE